MDLLKGNPASTIKFILYIFFTFLLSISCNDSNHKRGFYFWKSNANNVTDSEKNTLQKTGTNAIYIKLFEVGLDENNKAIPISKSQLKADSSLKGYTVIPTVFIENAVFKNISKPAIETLAKNCHHLLSKYYNQKFPEHPPIAEIQFDCDWTKKTKDNYFLFLEHFTTLTKAKLSCTLRLYPYKYPELTGIPPVSRVSLMCYNLIPPFEQEYQNSIQNNDELAKYLKGAETYPLPIDIALPIFSWMQVYKNDRFHGVFPAIENDTAKLQHLHSIWYQAKEDISTERVFIKQGDKIKLEESGFEETLETIKLLKSHIELKKTSSILLFHLDEHHLNRFTNEKLTAIYTAFN